MPFTPGNRHAHYEILSALGSGGMGEVYKARDTKLDRTVALKVLPPEFVSDPDRRRRFVQEARAASALDHPNIITIHDIAEADGVHFIVMQYVPGKTLRELVGRLKVNEAVAIAMQIADGLAAAHAHGIVHRDLKPENVIVQDNGTVKLLDFGLAKVIEPVEVDFEALTQTKNELLSREGLVVGTAPYMSPEQAQGQKVDARSDIFSFGSVFYEMVTGRRAFSAKSVPELLTAIIREEPAKVSELVPSVPHQLERLIHRALRKEKGRRFQSMADVRVELAEIRDELESGSFVSAAALSRLDPSRPGKRWRWVTIGLVVLGASLAGWWYVSRTERLPPPRTVPITSSPDREHQPAISPDGDLVAFTKASESGTEDLYIKQIDGGEPLILLEGIGDIYTPAWSPDGQRIAYIRHVEADEGAPSDGVFIIPALGGAERQIGVFRSMHGLSWSPDGKFLAIPHQETPETPFSIYLVSLETGEARKLTKPPPEIPIGDFTPRFSRDGETVAFVRGWAAEQEIYIVSVEGGEERRLTSEHSNLQGLDWAPDGKSIVFSTGRSGGTGFWSLWRVSLSGGEPEQLGVGEQGTAPTVSREGGRLAYVRANANSNIWRSRLPSGSSAEPVPAERFIASTGLDYLPEYSPDGTGIMFTSSRSGSLEIWVCDSDGTNPRQLTFLEHSITITGNWSPDGKQIAFWSTKEGSADIYVVSATGGLSRRLTTETSNETDPTWSRDGRWMYFSSNRSGQPEIWKMPAEGGDAVQLTHGRGTVAFESPDGAHLYFAKQDPNGGPPGIWHMPGDGEEEELVLENVGNRDWAPTEKGIYYLDRRTEPGPAVELYEFGTGEVSHVAVLEHPPTGFRLTVSPDGTWLVYARSEGESDIMLVENFR